MEPSAASAGLLRIVRRRKRKATAARCRLRGNPNETKQQIMNQASGNRRVLVCENPDRPGMGIAAELQKFSNSHHFNIIRAADKEAARGLLQALPIGAVIIDVGRESGEAQALLRSIGRGFPSLPLFVFNGFMIPGIAEKAKEYDHIRYCEDPGELTRFISLILEGMAPKKRGMIEGILLTNFLHWLNSEKLSGQVVVSSGVRQGVLSLKEGRLIAATMGNSPSSTALAEMSAWEKVTVEIREGALPGSAATGQSLVAPAVSQKPPPGKKAGQEHGSSSIETLRLARRGGTLSIRIKALQLAVEAIRDMLPDSLLRVDIFLSTDGRSLAGWNSQPLACSAFAGITRSLMDSLAATRFPPLGNYYLFELVNETLVLMVVSGELHMGLLLAKNKVPLGLLTNIILPQATKALDGSYTIERPA
jgi:hypothetical protein